MHIHFSASKILFLAIFALISCFASQLCGQTLDHVQGELIVQLNERIDAKSWATKTSKDLGNSLQIKHRISPILDLYVVKFDFTNINEEHLLLHILRDKDTYLAQYNHFVTLRSTVPNDAQFNDQWQYINTGQDGGTVGADIDMDLAWDLATGGLTANGDTIVVCVIDDGIDGSHPDISPNLFFNYAEIPGNEIDDDNNGFVDDYKGWNTGTSTDNVYTGGGHGTPVAGIVGAKGNNEIGVAGVNWNVKLMIVRGGTGVESEVLASYSYPLAFRKKYNETNGAEGAFVVSTNASWGIDQGQPSDAPLWCAFYDTLGSYGILNCGATANVDSDIDAVGDLPTACSSDHMISVTNMNRNDMKVTGAGYGAETIDLGAFGSETWTTQFGGGYGAFGGTSGATPHVTGAIALLYSANCSNIAEMAMSSPAETALLMKQIIMAGTDFNTSLQGITVSEGRLNVHNSMQLLLTQYCGDCPPAIAAETVSIGDNSVELNWNTNDSINSVNLRYQQLGAMDWTEIENASSPLTIADLEPCSQYVYQLQTFCNLDTIQYGFSVNFTSGGCCVNPDILELESLNTDEATVQWSTVEAAISYNLRYRETGAMDWNETNAIELTVTLIGLKSCTEYEVQIQSVCNLASPDFTESLIFFTVGCEDPCSELSYCEITGYDSSEEWIASFSLGNLINVSTSDNGYGEYLDVASKPFIKGGTYVIEVAPDYAGENYEEFIIAWLDHNQNGEFEESEIIFETGMAVNEATSENIVIPIDIADGRSRLRIAMRYEAVPGNCTEEGFDEYGEVEDYCISVGCPTINGIELDHVDNTSAILKIIGDENASSFDFRYRNITATDWIAGESLTLQLTLNNLDICTDYEIQVRAVCSDITTGYSASTVFKTECESSILHDQSGQSFYVQPNPFASHCTIVVNTESQLKDCQLSIINHLGQVVFSQVERFLETGETKIHLNTDSFTAGVYIIHISNEDVSMVRKVIKF